jgi:hypothetical protein
MLFICDIPITVLGVLSSNVVIFLICLPRVHLANATVLMTTATMLNCKFNSVFRIQGKSVITLRVCYIIIISKRIVHSFIRKSYARQLVRYYAHHILTYHV